MATNPFGKPGTSISGGQGETVHGKASFADALRSLAQSTAFGSADAAASKPLSTNTAPLTGQQRLNPQAADAAMQLQTASPASAGNALDQMRPLASASPANALGSSTAQTAAQGLANTAVNPAKSAAQNLNTGLQGTAQTPFGQSFQPNAYGMAWDQPKALIQSYFNFSKMPLHSGGLAMAQQNADSMKLLYALLNGQKPGTLDFGNYLDWSGKYLQNSMTPGGSYATPQQVISAIAHPDPKSPIFNLYYGADLTPDQQVGNVLSGLRYGLQGSMPAPMLASTLSRAQELGNNYEAWRMTHPDGGYTFGDYLRQQDPGTFGKL